MSGGGSGADDGTGGGIGAVEEARETVSRRRGLEDDVSGVVDGGVVEAGELRRGEVGGVGGEGGGAVGDVDAGLNGGLGEEGDVVGVVDGEGGAGGFDEGGLVAQAYGVAVEGAVLKLQGLEGDAVVVVEVGDDGRGRARRDVDGKAGGVDPGSVVEGVVGLIDDGAAVADPGFGEALEAVGAGGVGTDVFGGKLSRMGRQDEVGLGGGGEKATVPSLLSDGCWYSMPVTGNALYVPAVERTGRGAPPVTLAKMAWLPSLRMAP